MAGDDLTLGNLGVRGAAVFGPIGAGAQSITGIYLVTVSTNAPGVIAPSTAVLQTISSTAFTWAQNDIVLGPSFRSTGAVTNYTAGTGISAITPTATGGLAVVYFNASTANATFSTGPFLFTVFRTT